MLDRFRFAVAFLTRVPTRSSRPATPSDLGGSLIFFPLVGLALGLLLAGAARALEGRLPAALIGVALTALLALLTGGLHIDGLADVFDGLGGGRGERDRALAIMRDARIGAHGATALVLVLLVKSLALGAALPAGNLRVIALFPVLGRWLAVVLIRAFPYARPEGVGRAFRDHSGPRELAGASMIALAVAVWAGAGSVGSAAVAFALVLGCGAWWNRRFGGLTGDAYGAAIEIGEAAFLCAWVAHAGAHVVPGA